MTVARPHWRSVAAVAAGGAVGAPLRYQLGLWFPTRAGRMPYTTLIVNLSGAFVLGVVLTLLLERWPPTRYVRPFFCTGVLGAYTTFSTFSVDLAELTKDGHLVTAGAYAVLSLAGGLALTRLGMGLARSRRA